MPLFWEFDYMNTMKIKRLLSVVTVFCIAMAAMLFAMPRSNAVVLAVGESEKLFGYEYTVEYLMKDLGLDVDGDATIKYSLVYDYAAGADVTAADSAVYSEAEEKTVEYDSSIKFLRADCRYKFDVTDKDNNNTVCYVKTFADFDDVAITYANDLSSFKTALNNYAATLKTGDSFRFSEIEASLEDVISCPHFDIDKLNVVANYYSPDSDSPLRTSGTGLSSLYFTVTRNGVYSFYFTFTDSLNNSTSIDELVLGNGGYYTDANGDGEYDSAIDVELVVPVFTFSVNYISTPEVIVGASENAFLDLEYEVESLTITASNYTARYKLYFIPEDKNGEYDKDDYATDAEYIQAVLANSAIIDVTDEIFDDQYLTFTPTIDEDLGIGKGYYYVLVGVYDNNGYSDEAMTRAIACLEEYKEVVPEKQFFKYNVTSIVFLSISAASFIAILVLIFIKPKKENELEVKSE